MSDLIIRKIVFICVFFLSSLFFLTFVPSSAHAATYYVSTNGSNSNSGSQSSPWLTIQKAADAMSSGDTVIVNSGTYNERVIIRKSGTANLPITFQANGKVTSYGFKVEGNYIHIKGFTMTSNKCDQGVESSGIYVTGDYCRIEGNNLFSNPRYGIYTAMSSDYCLIKNNKAELNGFSGFAIDGNNHLVEDNEVSKTVQAHPICRSGDADGIRFFGKNNVFRRNYIHSIVFNGTTVTDAHIDCFQTFGTGEFWSVADGVTIERNTCDMISTNNSGDHTTATMLAYAKNITIKNNLFRTYRGVNEGGNNLAPNNGIYVYNNTFVSDLNISPSAYPRGVSMGRSTNVVVRNNIFYNFQDAAIYYDQPPTTLTISNNIAFRSDNRQPTMGRCNTQDCRVVNPLFINPTSKNFQLSQGSPAINAGSSIASVQEDNLGVSRPQGNGYDIGAYEFSGLPAPTPTTPPTTPPQPPTPIPVTRISLPGRIEAESYHSFYEIDSAFDITPNGVDTKPSIGEAGTTVGMWKNSEWLEYQVDITVGGTYSVGGKVGSQEEGRRIQVSVDSVPSGTINVPKITSWNSPLPYTNNLLTINLTPGNHTIRLTAMTDWQDIDFLDFSLRNNLNPADANSDGIVDGIDYIVWVTNYGLDVSGSSKGDFDNNGKVDGIDYVIWLNNFGK